MAMTRNIFINDNVMPIEMRRNYGIHDKIIVGVGMTSIIYAVDDKTVIMVTRDPDKAQLICENKTGELLGIELFTPQRQRDEFELPLFFYRMDMLKSSKIIDNKIIEKTEDEKRISTGIVHGYINIREHVRNKYINDLSMTPFYVPECNTAILDAIFHDKYPDQYRMPKMSLEARQFAQKTLEPLLSMNIENFVFDIQNRDFMFDSENKMHLVDPIVCNHILDFIGSPFFMDKKHKIKEMSCTDTLSLI